MAFALKSATSQAVAARPAAASRRSLVVKATKYDEELIATAVSVHWPLAIRQVLIQLSAHDHNCR